MTAEDDRYEEARTPAAAAKDLALPFTRRRFMGGAALAGTTALSPWLLAGCAKPVEEPWADGTYWSDGTGWIEREGIGWLGG